MSDAFDAEMTAALRRLTLARTRMDTYRLAFGEGRVDKDLARRLRDALGQVRALEFRVASALLAA